MGAERPALATLLDVREHLGGGSVAGAIRVPREDVSRYGILAGDERPDGYWRVRAIVGPAAAAEAKLEILPCRLARWEDWLRDEPRSSVLAPILSESERYKDDVYGSYDSSDRLRFPVDPLPPPGSPPVKTRLYIAKGPGGWRLTPLRPGPNEHRLEVAGPDDVAGPCLYAFWFAWYAAHPDDPGTWTATP